MSHTMLLELQNNRKKLNYYLQLKKKFEEQNFESTANESETPHNTPADTWIEIYSNRIQQLEQNVSQLDMVS